MTKTMTVGFVKKKSTGNFLFPKNVFYQLSVFFKVLKFNVIRFY